MTIYSWILNHIKKNNSEFKISFVIFFSLIFIIFFLRIIFYKNNQDALDYSNTNFKVLGLNLPTNLSFANEKVPLNDFKIKENLEKEFFENKSWKSSAISLFNKVKKWFPLIEPILKQQGVPDDFKYVAVIESHLSNVVSPVGAAGFWQLMPETAREFGLIVNDEVDERYDVEKATYVACKHFKSGYNYFSNWTLAAAAYNVGIGSIQNALKKQEANSYYDLILNSETGSFIYRILAYKTLISNPKHFGINYKINYGSFFPAFKIVTVDSSITNIATFAKQLNTNVVILKTFNAWLIGDKLTNTEKRVYKFKVPKNNNIDLSIYFNDVFPQKINSDSTIIFQKSDTVSITKDSL